MSTDDSRICSTTGEPPDKVRAEQTEPTGQHKSYLILCDAERAKGFVKPYRDTYRHRGPPGPRYELRDLTTEELEQNARWSYVKFEPYPQDELPVTGRYWTQAQLDAIGKGCGTTTTMGRKLAETYARDPNFYGATFCVTCNRHLPLSEFTWEPDGEPMDPTDPDWQRPAPTPDSQPEPRANP